MTEVELLVRVVDEDGDADTTTRAGDVITTCPAGHAWSVAEQTHPAWVRIRTHLLPVEVEMLAMPDRDPVKDRLRLVHAYGLDCAALGVEVHDIVSLRPVLAAHDQATHTASRLSRHQPLAADRLAVQQAVFGAWGFTPRPILQRSRADVLAAVI